MVKKGDDTHGKVIHGGKGIGKTKLLLDHVNGAVAESKGDIVFIDTRGTHTTDLRHEIRYVNISEFPLADLDDLFGFLCGMIAEDYDITAIYMDGLEKFEKEEAGYHTFFDKVKSLENKYNMNFIFSANKEMGALPDYVISEYNQ